MQEQKSFPVFTFVIIAMVASFMAIYTKVSVNHAYVISMPEQGATFPAP